MFPPKRRAHGADPVADWLDNSSAPSDDLTPPLEPSQTDADLAGTVFTDPVRNWMLTGQRVGATAPAPNAAPAPPEHKAPVTAIGRLWEKTKAIGGWSPLPADIGEEFEHDVMAPMQKGLDDKAMRGESLSLGDYVKTGLAGAGHGFLDTLRSQATPVGLATMIEKPAKGIADTAREALTGGAISGLTRVAGGIFGAEGAETALDSNQTWGHRALGAFNAVMGGLGAFGPRSRVPHADGEVLPEQGLLGDGQSLAGDIVDGEVVRGQITDGRQPEGPGGPIDGEIVPDSEQRALPPGPDPLAELLGADPRALPGPGESQGPFTPEPPQGSIEAVPQYGLDSKWQHPAVDSTIPRSSPAPRPVPEAPAVPAAAPPVEAPAPAGLTAAEVRELKRQGFDDATIAKMAPGAPSDPLGKVIPPDPTLDSLPPLDERMAARAARDAARQAPPAQTPEAAPPADVAEPIQPGPTDPLAELLSPPAEPPAPVPSEPPANVPAGAQVDPLEHLMGTDLGRMVSENQGAVSAGHFDDPHVDTLTGLQNRRGWELAGGGAPKPGRVHAYVDFDNYKVINDTMGHAEGDRALKVATEAMSEFARRNGDRLARVGGDEFALDLEAPHTPEAAAALQHAFETTVTKALHDAGFPKEVGVTMGLGDNFAAAEAGMQSRKVARGVSKTKDGKRMSATAPPEEAPRTNGISETRVDPANVQVDAKTYQFKGGGDAAGVTDRLKAVEEWDPIAGAASPTIVHQRTDGSQFIVDGHQRLGLAKRLQAAGKPVPPLKAIVLHESDGITVNQAKRIGAMLNLQQGTGSAVDIAKVLRESPLTPAESARIPKDQTSGSKLRTGEDLAKLGDDAFLRVVNGQVHPNPAKNEVYGALVGRLVENHPQQIAALQALEKAAPAGVYEAEQFVKAILADGFERGTQVDLFGNSEVAVSLAEPIAQIMATARRMLQSEKSALGNAVRNESRLKAKGNVLDTDANRAGAEQAGALDRLLDTYGHTVGPVREELKRVAAELQRGEITAHAAAQRLVAAVEAEHANPTGGSELRQGIRDGVEDAGPGPTPEPTPEQPIEPDAVDPDDVASPHEDLTPHVSDPVEDLLSTGEAQPRLPGDVGNVRETNVQTPAFEAPFALERETAAAPKAKQDSLTALLDEIELPEPIGPMTAAAVEAGPRTPDDLAVPTHSDTAAGNSPAEAPVAPTPDAPAVSPVPPNVKDFLVKRLNYTPAEVDAMGPAAALKIGNEVRMYPGGASEGIKAHAKAKPQRPRSSEPGPNLGEDSARVPTDELAKLLGIQDNRTAMQRTRVEPGEGAPATPKLTPAQLERAQAMTTESQSARADAAKGPAAPVSQSEAAQAGNRMVTDARVRAKLLDNPTPENLDEYVRLLGEAADRQGAREMKGGTSKEGQVRVHERTGEYLASGLGGLEKLYKERPDLFWQAIRTAGGGLIGAMLTGDDSPLGDDPLMGAVIGAAAGAASPRLLKSIAKRAPTVAKVLKDTLPEFAGGAPAAKGKPVARAARDLGKDISGAEMMIYGQPHRTVPDVWREISPTLDELARAEAEAPSKTPRLFEFTRQMYLKEAIATISEHAKGAKEDGLPRRAKYLQAMADELSGAPTWLERMASDLTSGRATPKDVGKFFSRIERAVYTKLLGFALDSAIVNRTQIGMAVPHIGIKGVLEGVRASRTPAGKAATEFLDIKEPTDAPQVLAPAKATLLRKVVKTALSPMAASDTKNRKDVYLGVLQHARKQGLNPKEAHEFAMEITAQTQGQPGELGANPFHRQLGPLRMFTKYPGVWAQWVADIATHPDPAVRRRGLGYMLGVPAAAAGMGINAMSIVFPRLLLTAPAAMAAWDLASHTPGVNQITGKADHTLGDDAKTPVRYPAKVGHEVKDFLRYGAGTHPEFDSSGNPRGSHEGWEGFLSLLGVDSMHKTDATAARNEAYGFTADSKRRQTMEGKENKHDLREAIESGDHAAAAEAAAKMSPAQVREFYRRNGKTPYQIMLERVPKADRPAFEQRFKSQLGGEP